jgi:hypothetical protein
MQGSRPGKRWCAPPGRCLEGLPYRRVPHFAVADLVEAPFVEEGPVIRPPAAVYDVSLPVLCLDAVVAGPAVERVPAIVALQSVGTGSSVYRVAARLARIYDLVPVAPDVVRAAVAVDGVRATWPNMSSEESVPWILLLLGFPSQVPPPQLSASATPLAAMSAAPIVARRSSALRFIIFSPSYGGAGQKGQPRPQVATELA